MTKTRHFAEVSTLEELKKEYKRLAMLHHPDLGGDTETMKAINNEYDRLFEELKNTHKNKEGEYYTKESTAETAGEWRELIEKLIRLHMEDVKIEVIGSFVWLSGNTKPYKDQIGKNGLGFKWSKNKSSWYKAPEGYRKHSGKEYDMDDIRGMYGSSTIRNEGKSKPARAALTR